MFNRAEPFGQLCQRPYQNIWVKLFLIWTSGSGGDVTERNLLSTSLEANLIRWVEPFRQFWLRTL